MLHALAHRLAQAPEALVVDLGFGASSITTLELAGRLRGTYPGVQILGLEIDPVRVAAAEPFASPPQLAFALGGFELAGRSPVVVRAMNVLRQYDERAVPGAWAQLCVRGASVIDGTCDEIGRRASWLLVEGGRPISLTLSAHLASLQRPSELAERLPKALIARNVRGEPVHDLLAALDSQWAGAAPLSAFGPRQRWEASVAGLRSAGWPIIGGRARWRLGELTVRWPPDF